ncbi:C-type mannose receptor 2-like [Haliotis cracherodii]|uniref:C-type mannose receptor 2-like n=1 Tax=Haliotis cracherodii TaxID=6455 RepID=UPI0039ED024C
MNFWSFVGVLLYLITACTTQTSHCPTPAAVSSLMKVFNKRCLEFVLGKTATWTSAERDCIHRGGHLVEVASDSMQQYLESVLQTRYVGTGVWIGLTAPTNTWIWTSGSVDLYRNWASGSPSSNTFDGRKDCVYMATGTWTWHNAACSSYGFLISRYVRLNYICEFQSLSSTTTELTTRPQSTTLVTTCPYTITSPAHDTFSFGSHTYQISTQIAHAVDAQKACGTRGGNLVAIPDWTTLVCVHEGLVKNLKFNGAEVWIGLSDAEREGQWKWDNGETFSYHHWANGEPGSLLGTNEDCVLMETYSGLWKDTSCNGGLLFATGRFHYLCQYDHVTSSTIRTTKSTTPSTTASTSASTTAITTTTTTATTTPAPKPSVTPCPILEACTLDCGLSGFKKDASGCHTCACDG